MSTLCCQLLRNNFKRLIRHSLPVRHKIGQGAYEGEGKTTVTILNRDIDYALMIDKISMQGFGLNIGVNILGPMIIFPKTVIGWNIETENDIHEDSLSLFRVLDPRPDILILGLNKNYPRGTKFIDDFKSIAKNLDINHEVLPVDKACTTFNFLNAEKRYAVAALLPPNDIDDIDIDSLNDLSMRRVLYGHWESAPDPKLENPNKMADILFPSEAAKKDVEDMQKARNERRANKKNEKPDDL
ncbi:NADH dehydrogenase [ubiquinone] 1 alpha subcomplex assembly factor 3 [Fopius arisanus]|uniref:NADH dehydrogenase [ubiquinone] 1 alpha subcomplex assembly factor 3 n=1 Tax=Fopius arisanus TaxID=64838 RepID=A0A0C9RZV8_9HYME|nr:PREDICTED: NADH dehydrogenase [ubiquinone] 1 alpha subcomplex assembly factor 3 [Fopius arisanus]